MLLILLVIAIIVSIASEFISQAIYFIKIRTKLVQAGKELSFDWLPQKRRAQVAEYKSIIKGSKSDSIWVEAVLWLYYISWIFLIIAALLAIIITQT